MQRIAIVLMFLNLFVFPLQAQQTSLSMLPDGSGRIHVDEPDGTTKNFRLSPKALDFTLDTSIDLLFDAEFRGAMTYNKFHGSDEDVYTYQQAVGMTPEQIALMAKRQFEAHETTKDAAYAEMDRLTRFDELSPDDVLALETGFRDAVQVELEAKDAILNEVLTPEQLRLLDEIDLAEGNMNLKAFEVLGLSDEQKRQLDVIRQELMPEMKKDFLAQITAVRDFAKELLEKHGDGFGNDKEEVEKLLAKVFEKLSPEERRDLERKLQTFYEEQEKKNVTRIELAMKKMLALLTPEQKKKFDAIKDRLSKKLDRIRADWQEKQKAKKPEDDSWRDAWKPGDPVPEGAVPPRPNRKPFPL